MSSKSMAYDHPTYLTRTVFNFPSVAAGASGVTSKFVAFANLVVYGLQVAAVAIGAATSSYTGWNGTATVTATVADQISLIRVMNTAAPGAAPAMATGTYGPFIVANYNGTGTGTQTNQVGVLNYISLAGVGTGAVQAGSAAALGGIAVNQGDLLYCTRGTDTLAVTAIAMDYSVAPLASVGA